MVNIRFSKWHKWSERKNIPERHLSGVYALANFDKTPHKVDVLDKRIIYFGETKRSFLTRWREFDYSAFQDKTGHSAGWTYKEKVKNDGNDLFVALCPIEENNPDLTTARRLFVERKLIFEFVKRHNKLPKINTK